MKKRLIKVLALLMVFTMMTPTSVLAAEEEVTDNNKYYISYDMEGNITDYYMPNDDFVKQTRSGTNTKTTQIDSGTVTEQYLGYHPNTSIWRTISAYYFSTISKVNMSITVSGCNATIGISKESSTTTTYKLKADQTKYSKVKVYTSYTWKKYRADVYDNYAGAFQYSYNFVTTKQTHEKLQVVYQ